MSTDLCGHTIIIQAIMIMPRYMRFLYVCGLTGHLEAVNLTSKHVNKHDDHKKSAY